MTVLGSVGARRIGRERHGGAVDVGGPRPRRLLAALAIDAGRAVPVDRLADRVWGDDLPDDPRGALYTLVARLRQAVGADAIVTDGAGYRLAAGGVHTGSPVVLDAIRFVELMDAADDPALGVLGRLALLDEALRLWSGAAYDGVSSEGWARAEADRLEELRAVAVERRFDAMLTAGKHSDAVGDLAAAVDAYPLRDRLVGQRMLALFRMGRQAEATRAFQAHRARLATDLGLEPGAELVALDRRIVDGDVSLHLDAAGLEPPGRALRGYRLGEQLGEGAFAVVFRGTQPSVGRDVAVKVIRAELANRPEFVRRFEAEAHLVAALEHPHIVPLYDFWREPDRAYVVFRYLRGGSLEARLSDGGRLDVAEVRRLVAQVGAALSTAHRAGVVHRDVKPANVFLDGDGNYYLGDFGIALEGIELSDPAAALSAGSPAYAAPEQLRREPIGPPADVHGLGITVYEALTGQLPFPDAVTQAELLRRQLDEPIPSVRARRQDVPAAVDDVLARATAKRPDDRFTTVDAFVAAFEGAVDGTVAAPARRGAVTAFTIESRNPYKGLRAFGEADAADFKGRARLVDRLVACLARSGTAGRIATVVGPSGIGKSSVVRAGLVPALRRGAVPGSDAWFVTTMVPGREPFDELAAALLRVATAVPQNLMGQLTADQRGVARVIKTLVPESSAASVLLVVDQFEELFTLCEDAVVRQRFLDALEYALTDARCPLRVVLTLRADFYDRPLRHGSFARLIEPSTVAVTALAPDEIDAAIVEPAAAVGCEFEPGLVSEIVADVGDQPGALPLMQYALTELWERRVSELLTRAAYREIGGVAGALAGRAEELTEAASEGERVALRRAFGRLVTLGERTEDTRRRVAVAELGTDAGVAAVVERFGAARLLSFDRDPVSREPTVEVAHEALIRQWPRLRTWLDEDRDDLRVQRQVADAAHSWDRGARDDGELYRGGRLEAAESWAAHHVGELAPLEAEFLAASTKRRRDEQAAARRHVRRLRGALVGVGAVAVVALLAGVLAVRQQNRADREATRAREQSALAAGAASDAETAAAAAQKSAGEATQSAAEAETRRLVADAAAIVGENRDVALLLASEAYRRDPSPETLAGLQRVLTSTGAYLGTIGAGVEHLAGGWLDDGTIVGVTADEVRLYDGQSHALTATIPLPAKMFVSPVGPGPVSIGAHGVAVGTEAGSVLLVQGGRTRELAVSRVAIRSIAVAPDVLAVGDIEGVVHLVDRATAVTRWTTQVLPERSFRVVMGEAAWAALPAETAEYLTAADATIFGAGPAHVVLAPDGAVVAGTGVFVRRLDAATGAITASSTMQGWPPVPWPRPVYRVANRPSGGLYVQAGFNSVAELGPDLTVGRKAFVPTGRSDANITVTAMAIDTDGTPMFGLSNGLIARGLVDDPTDAPRNVSTGVSTISSLARSPRGGAVLAAGPTGMVLWSTDGRELLARAVPASGHTEGWVAPDDREVIATSVSRDEPARFYDLTTDPPTRRELTSIDPRGEWTVDGDPLNRFYQWSGGGLEFSLVDRRSLSTRFTVRDATYNQFSYDGHYWAVGMFSRTAVRVFDVDPWRQVSPVLDLSAWSGPSALAVIPAFDASGARLFASVNNGTAVVFDTTTWAVAGVIEPTDHGGAVAVRFSRDGSTLVTLGKDGSIAVRDPRTLVFQRSLSGGVTAADTLTYGVYLSADGQYLVTTRDATPRLWDLRAGVLIGGFPHKPGLVATGNDLGDRLQLVTLLDDRVLVWNLDVTAWPAIACRAAGRNLTSDEWAQFGPKNVPYQATCPQWALVS